MGNDNSPKIPHINATKKRMTTVNNMKYLELIPKVVNHRKLDQDQTNKDTNLNQNIPYSFSGRSVDINADKKFNISSCKNLKNVQIKGQNKKLDYYKNNIRHSGQNFIKIKKSIHPLSSFSSFDRTPRTFTILKTFNYTSPKTYLKIKSPKINLNSNKMNFYSFHPKVNSHVHYNPCNKVNKQSPIRAKIRAKQEKKELLKCLSNQIMEDLNDKTLTIKQKILKEKKKIEENKIKRMVSITRI